jgi:hypothetical protein
MKLFNILSSCEGQMERGRVPLYRLGLADIFEASELIPIDISVY